MTFIVNHFRFFFFHIIKFHITEIVVVVTDYILNMCECKEVISTRG